MVFIQKPGDLATFVTVVASLVQRWGGIGEGAGVTVEPEEGHEEESPVHDNTTAD
jgi:hypothetical protein